MLIMTNEAPERVSTAHRAKLAYVYVRQSSPMQVRQHQESTELQYRLVNRAADLGWPRERITVIDEDLGKSGATSSGREGFQRLIAEISLGKVGLVLSLDASRLARDNRDWHQLLELCSIFGVLTSRWRTPVRPQRLPRPPAVGPLRNHERSRAAPDPAAAAPGGDAEGSTWGAAASVACWSDTWSCRRDRAQS